MSDKAIKLGVLISGSGTNLQAIIDRIADGTLDASIELVVSSRPSAFGLKRAEAAGLQTLTLSKDVYADPEQADEIIAAELVRRGVDYVIMAGYMRKVHDPILATFPNRVVNLHPALLPSFPGAHAIQDAYDRGVKVTGVTVHFANADYDAGPIIAQRALAVELDGRRARGAHPRDRARAVPRGRGASRRRARPRAPRPHRCD